MYTTNNISVEDCPNARSICKNCNKPIFPHSPRVRTDLKRYCHLNCYRPKHPVTILPANDVVNKLQCPQNLHTFEEWVNKWNSQFHPVEIDTIKLGQGPTSPAFNRAHIEAFKFLTYSEVCLLVGLTCRVWRDFAWSAELWRCLAERDYPASAAQIPQYTNPREAYVILYTQACLSCRRLPKKDEIRVLCPTTKRPICSTCFQKPGSCVFQASEYASLLGISPQYMREASVPVYSYNAKNWVYTHQADMSIVEHRVKRRQALLTDLAGATHSFGQEDLQKIKSLNLARAKYIGVVLKHKFEGEEDLIDLLNYIYAAGEGRGLTVDKLVKRNRRRRARQIRQSRQASE